MQHGYFTPDEEPAVVQAIAAAKPDILFVAFGAPRQEKWIRRHQEELGASVAIGVGGSFDVFAGRVHTRAGVDAAGGAGVALPRAAASQSGCRACGPCRGW